MLISLVGAGFKPAPTKRTGPKTRLAAANKKGRVLKILPFLLTAGYMIMPFLLFRFWFFVFL